MMILTTLSAILFAGLMLWAAFTDVRTRTIANWIPLVILGLGVARWLFPFDGGALVWALIAGFIALAMGFALFAMGWIGGGDAKLIAAAVVWIGQDAAAVFLVAMGLVGLGLAIWQVMSRRFKTLEEQKDKKATLPYGVAVAAGALLALPLSIGVNF
jgi:prepilin peptidase CpaA